jgi:dihydrofolate reductase
MRTHTAIVCVSPRGIIGVNGRMPWYLPEDLAWFREFTMGKQVVMGARTYWLISNTLEQKRKASGDILSGRSLFMFSRSFCGNSELDENAVIAGGAETYAHFMPRTREVYMTQITGGFDDSCRGGNDEELTFFPYFAPSSEVACAEVVRPKTVSRTGIEFTIIRYELRDKEGK